MGKFKKHMKAVKKLHEDLVDVIDSSLEGGYVSPADVVAALEYHKALVMQESDDNVTLKLADVLSESKDLDEVIQKLQDMLGEE